MRGLTLEGGGMRGMYSEGIFDTFIKEGIEFDRLVGVSAGALFGVNYISEQVGRGLRYNSNYMGDKRYISLRSLITTGNMVNSKFAYYTLPMELDVFDNEKYKASNKRLWSMAIDIETGEATYTKIEDVFEQMESLKASGSLPFISRPVKIDGHKYLDGGMAESIPVRKTMELGCDKVVVILTRPADYKKNPASFSSKLFTKLWYHRYPKLVEALNSRSERYNKCLDEIFELEKEGKIFVFRPSEPIEVGRLEKDANKLKKVYDLGIKDAYARLDELKAYLN